MAVIQGFADSLDYRMRPPQKQEDDAEKDADDDIAPKRADAQPQAVHKYVAADERHVFFPAREPDVPAPERLKRDDSGVDGDNGAERPAEEIEEVEVVHWIKSE